MEIKFKEKFCIDVNSSEFFQTTQDGKVQKLGITCVFSEPQFNPELVRTVTDGTSVTTREIDPLGTTFTLGPDFYLDVLRAVAQSMARCL